MLTLYSSTGIPFARHFSLMMKCLPRIPKASRPLSCGVQLTSTDEPSYFYFHPTCMTTTRESIGSSFTVFKDYITEEEEDILMKELEPHLKRLKYEFNHWDDVSQGSVN